MIQLNPVNVVVYLVIVFMMTYGWNGIKRGMLVFIAWAFLVIFAVGALAVWGLSSMLMPEPSSLTEETDKGTRPYSPFAPFLFFV